MIRHRVGWLIAAVALTLLVSASAPAFPQEKQEAEQEAPVRIASTAPSGEAVEDILREQEKLMRGQRFSYDPAGRRDPFLSLYEQVRLKDKGKRPKGIAGMLVTEIDLVGIVQDASGGDVAFFTGSDNKGYFMKVGDRTFDGTLIGVDPRTGAVTFRQEVDDPRLIKPYRDVVKKLSPLEES
jgi:hypothetical protein